jgi:hypothetical protein
MTWEVLEKSIGLDRKSIEKIASFLGRRFEHRNILSNVRGTKKPHVMAVIAEIEAGNPLLRPIYETAQEEFEKLSVDSLLSSRKRQLQELDKALIEAKRMHRLHMKSYKKAVAYAEKSGSEPPKPPSTKYLTAIVDAISEARKAVGDQLQLERTAITEENFKERKKEILELVRFLSENGVFSVEEIVNWIPKQKMPQGLTQGLLN